MSNGFRAIRERRREWLKTGGQIAPRRRARKRPNARKKRRARAVADALARREGEIMGQEEEIR